VGGLQARLLAPVRGKDRGFAREHFVANDIKKALSNYRIPSDRRCSKLLNLARNACLFFGVCPASCVSDDTRTYQLEFI